jgi:hypothetical protein
MQFQRNSDPPYELVNHARKRARAGVYADADRK